MGKLRRQGAEIDSWQPWDTHQTPQPATKATEQKPWLESAMKPSAINENNRARARFVRKLVKRDIEKPDVSRRSKA